MYQVAEVDDEGNGTALHEDSEAVGLCGGLG